MKESTSNDHLINVSESSKDNDSNAGKKEAIKDKKHYSEEENKLIIQIVATEYLESKDLRYFNSDLTRTASWWTKVLAKYEEKGKVFFNCRSPSSINSHYNAYILPNIDNLIELHGLPSHWSIYFPKPHKAFAVRGAINLKVKNVKSRFMNSLRELEKK